MYKNTEKQREDARAKRAIIAKIKDVPCMDCGIKYPPYVMDFDHRNPYDKKMNISRVGQWGIKTLLEEVKKCDIVCSNCHRIRTNNRK